MSVFTTASASACVSQCRQHPALAALVADALLAPPLASHGRGRPPVWLRPGDAPLWHRLGLDAEHTGTGEWKVHMHPTHLLIKMTPAMSPGVPADRRPHRLALLRPLLPTPQDGVPGTSGGSGQPAGLESSGPPTCRTSVVRRLCAAAARPAGGALLF